MRPRPHVQHDIDTAIHGLLRGNSFDPRWLAEDGPYHLVLGMKEGRLVFQLGLHPHDVRWQHQCALQPLRGVIRDYFFICQQFAEGAAHANPWQIETLDMARRAVHDEGSVLLAELLHAEVLVDMPTARHLFTLICVLQLGQRREGL